ncbi:hypothetical protein II582_00565 [bacterium]|nr:hypothetical protein [bacterium]
MIPTIFAQLNNVSKIKPHLVLLYNPIKSIPANNNNSEYRFKTGISHKNTKNIAEKIRACFIEILCTNFFTTKTSASH